MNSYEILKEIIQNYVTDMETINEKRLEAAERELQSVRDESTAFNILRQNTMEVYGRESTVA